MTRPAIGSVSVSVLDRVAIATDRWRKAMGTVLQVTLAVMIGLIFFVRLALALGQARRDGRIAKRHRHTSAYSE